MKHLNTPSTWATRALFVGLVAASLTACKKDKEETPTPQPVPINEEELITTLILTFTDGATPANVYELRYTDIDGIGGIAPVITGDTLPAGTTFQLAVRALDESGSTPEEITEEILLEDEEHQFFFQVTGANLQIAYADADGDGLPIGLANTATTGAASTGTLLVTLRHEPIKTAAGVSAGLIENAGGDTDIQTLPEIPVVIQ